MLAVSWLCAGGGVLAVCLLVEFSNGESRVQIVVVGVKE